tara:strand:- start:646 stop:1068 length:423 start_codon:yes stop_codon:yes gene_type:complete
MLTHALVENDTDRIIKRVDGSKEFRTGQPPVFQGKPFRWLTYTIDPDPAFDPETQKCERAVEVVSGDGVARTRPVRDLTADELNTRRIGKIRGIDDTLIRIIEDIMVAVATGQTLERASFPAQVWDKINERRALRGQDPV